MTTLAQHSLTECEKRGFVKIVRCFVTDVLTFLIKFQPFFNSTKHLVWHYANNSASNNNREGETSVQKEKLQQHQSVFRKVLGKEMS